MATKLTKAERVTQLMNSRKHKKGVITKRINEMSRIVADGGSRRQLKYLIDQLAAVRTTLHVVCDELATLDPDADMGYADKEDLRVDSCIGDAEAYLDRRRDDPPSTESLCDDWLQKHAAVNEELGSVSDTDSVSGVRIQDKSVFKTSQDHLGSSPLTMASKIIQQRSAASFWHSTVFSLSQSASVRSTVFAAPT